MELLEIEKDFYKKKIIYQTKNQLLNAIKDISEEEFHMKVLGELRSIADILIHICEVSYAFSMYADGEKYEWGTYTIPFHEMRGLLDVYHQLRKDAESKYLSRIEDKHVTELWLDYIVLHESYHIGQICMLRRLLQPEWDYYSIYKQI